MSPATDLDLTGQDLALLRDALVAAFPTRLAFRELAQYRLDTPLDVLVAAEASLNEVAFDLIEWARANGRLGELVACARAENPGNPELLTFADRFGIRPQAAPDAPGPGDLHRGLDALGDLMAQGDAREAVRAFETEFQAAVEQIDVLGTLKDVHDLLHTLQFRCYDGLARQAPRFPADDLAREIIAEHNTTLDETIVRLEAITAHHAFEEGPPAWLADLRDARGRIATALETSAAEPLKAAVRLLDRVLAVQPPRINTRLNDAARALRLGDLVAHLDAVHTRLRASSPDPAKLEQFETGIRSLQQLAGALRQLVMDHDRWQVLDVELRLERNGLLTDPEGLGFSWPRLRDQLVTLCGGNEAWATRLLGDCGKLDAALAAHDGAAERSIFIQVHSQAATRFYQVDVSLQSLCETLRDIGKPLTQLLRRLQ